MCEKLCFMIGHNCDRWDNVYTYIPICLNASMFARIIRDPASSTEEVSIRVFYEPLQIAFPNNVLVSQFHGWSLKSAPHSMEERGGVYRVISI